MLRNYVIDEMKNHLENMEGLTVYGADLGYAIFESENIDGSYTYSSHEAKEWIKEYFDELGELVEEITAQLGAETIPNVFDNPEAFQVVIMLECSSFLCGRCKTIENAWDEEITLTEEVIKNICKELENLKAVNDWEGFYEV